MKQTPDFNFFEMGMIMGSELVAYNTSEKAIVISQYEVLFREVEMSLAKATQLAQKNGSAVNPCVFWDYNGRNLGLIYRRVYGDDC